MSRYLKTAKTLRHQVKFLENISTEFMEEKWQEKLTTYANIQAVCDTKLTLLENIHFDHVMTEALFLFVLRFASGINTKMRIMFNDRYFEIKRIININEQNRWLQIIALEVL